MSEKSSCGFLYAIKAFAITGCLQFIVPHVRGFAVSSLYEAKLAREVIRNQGSVHITTPGFRPDEIQEIGELCNYISFNSLSQWERLKYLVGDDALCGLRINPQLPFIDDARYNPCRKHSKLGVPLEQLVTMNVERPEQLNNITGLHFHTNCLSSDLSQLLKTVLHLDDYIGYFLKRINWINLGGGYLFDVAGSYDDFYQAVDFLRSKYNLDVFIEPGAAIVNKAGYLVTSVIDLFESEGKIIAVLDTTINHLPEVFEYQYEPDVIGHSDQGRYEYILVGSTCLAGDLFGEYAFDKPLKIGSRIVFTEVGAYNFVKAHSFNGINLPSVYSLGESGELMLKKRFTYEDFASRCGAETSVVI